LRSIQRLDGGGGALSLGAARKEFLEAQTTKREAVDGTRELTIKELAQAYNRDVLSQRERAAEAWNVLRVHIVEAQADPARPAFGEWPAKAVRPSDLAVVIRYAKETRTIDKRRLGGPGVARVVLRELKAIFAHAVETGSLEMSPAAIMRARSFGLRANARARVLDADELKAFFDALDLTALLNGTAKAQRLSPTVRLGLAFQLYVPLRSHSLIGGRWEEFDLEQKRWTVPVSRQKLRKEDRAVARPFVAPLPATAVAILEKLKALSPKSPWVLASPAEAKPEKGGEQQPPRHIEPKALIRALSRLRSTGRLAFGSKVTVHDLRRTWRTLAEEAGVDHVVAERSLGHVTPLRTLGFSSAADVYARAQLIEQRANAAESVGAVLDRIRLEARAKIVPLASRR